MHQKLKQFSLVFLFLVFLTLSCKDPDNFEFPFVNMNVTINLDNDPEFAVIRLSSGTIEVLQHPNGLTSIGYDNNGIIIYNGIDRFYAFDRTCPNDLPTSVAVELDGSVAKCPVCNSVFVIPSEGQPSIGSVSRYFLHQYNTYYSNGILQIYN